MATISQKVWQLLGELIQAQKETERLPKEQSMALSMIFPQTV